MKNKQVFYIIVANILWGLIPIVVSDLFNEVSVLTVTFIRFFYCGIFFLILSLFLILYNNKFTDNKAISIKIYLHFFKNKNEKFYNLRYIYYFALLGYIGVVMQIFFYFMALKLTSIAIVMIGFIISNVLMAIYQHSRSERLDVFKLLYISMLIFSIGIIVYVKMLEYNQFAVNGLIYMVIFSLCMLFFHIFSNNDPYTKKELEIINDNKTYKLIRLLIKLSFIFLFGILLLLPTLLILYFIPIEPSLSVEISKFFQQLFDVSIIFRWDIQFINIFSTILPYLFLFLAFVNWNPYNLTYNQWSSVLMVIEPTTALLFGVIILNEFFPLVFLIITLFLLIVSILFRYIHENSVKVSICMLLSVKEGNMKKLPLKLLKYNGITNIEVLIGTYDMLLTIKQSSIRDFFLLETELRNLEEIQKTTILFINKINKINS